MELKDGADPLRTVSLNPLRESPDVVPAVDPDMNTIIRGVSDTSLGSQPAAAKSPGLIYLGDYEILHEIARGGMGVVYKAKHRTLGRLAAVKLIKSGELAQSEEVQRFQVEAQAAALLDHPGIVSVYESGQQGQQHYLAMAYVDGQSLWQRVKEAPLSPKVAARIMQQVAEAVQYAHEQGIVHRDLKPQNILLTKEGQPKVTDFGLAKKQGGDSSLTATGQILGTPSYMPPEQTKGTSDQVGPLADVYSLGATMYCLLTGRPPFQAATPLETMLQVANQEPVTLRQLNPSIPRDLETICLKCLQKQPLQRYSSAGELAADLQCYLNGDPIHARPVWRVEKVWRWGRRNPAKAALSASFVVLVGFAGLTSWLLQEQQRSRQVAQLTSSFEGLLDRPAADPSFIAQGESLLTALALFAPTQSEQESGRLWQAYANAIEVGVLQPKLSSDDEQLLADAVSKLSERNPDEATRLHKLLDGRRRSWRSVADLKAPFIDFATIILGDDIELEAGRLVRRGDPQSADAPPPVATSIAAAGKVRVEATFDMNWEAGKRLGIEFRYDEQNRYVFLVSADVPPVTESADESLARKFASEQRMNRRVKVQLLRNGVLLRSQDLELSALPPGPLRLDAQRDGDWLKIKLGNAEPLVFEDVFAIRSRVPVQFSLIWPFGGGLLDLTISTMPVAETTSPLEAGDVQFAQGDFDEAARQYRELANVSSDESQRQEARYKEALSLQTLGRIEEAEKLFESLLGETESRWSMLSAIQLWVIQVRARDHEQADATFALIAGRYSFSELATLVPEELRRELIEVYRPEPMPRLLRVLTYDPKRIEKLERFVALEDLFGSGEHERMSARCQLIDAVWTAGKHDLASQLIAQVNERARAANEEYARLQVLYPIYIAWRFQQGYARDVLNELELVMQEPSTKWTRDSWELWFFRAQCEAQLELWDDALRSMDRSLKLTGEYHGAIGISNWRTYNGVLLGFIHEKRGDSAQALATWRHRSDPGASLSNSANASLSYLTLRGLSGDLDRNDAEVFLSKITGSEPGTIGAAARGFLTPDLFLVVAREMFRTPHGREIAWQIANGELFPSEQVENVGALLLYEFVRQGAFEGNLSNAQHEEIWRTARGVVRERIQNGSFSALQVGQLGLSWKGTLNIFGWGGLAPNLPPEIRSPGAYALAHRMLVRSQLDDAAKLFSEASTYAPPDSALAKLAQQDSELLQSARGLAIFHKSDSKPRVVEILSNDEVLQRIEIDQDEEIALPVGNYVWRIADIPDDAKGQFTLTHCCRRIVELPALP